MAHPIDMTPAPYPLASHPAGGLAGDHENAGGVNLLAIAWQGRWLILLFTLVGGGIAWAYLQQVVPRYTSTARIYVEQQIPTLLGVDAGIGGMSSKLNTQAELIQSSPVLSAAVDAPELAAIESFRGVDNPAALVRRNLRVTVGDNDDIINVSIELPNPEDTAQIVNAVVDAYISKYAERRKTSAVEILDILRKEKNKRDAELDQRRLALEEFRKNHIALAVQTGEDNVVTQLFSTLAAELNASQIELLEAKTLYARAKSMLDSPSQLPFLMELARSQQSESAGASLETQIRQVEQDLIAQKSRWGDGYPSVKLLQDSLDKLRAREEKQQAAIVTAYVDTLRQNYELVVQRRDEIQRAYDKQFQLATEVSGQAAELAALQDAYDRTEKTCDILDKRISEIDLSEEVGAINVSPLEVAATGVQTYPVRSQMLSVGLACGALLGFGIAFLRDMLDHRLKSAEEIAQVLQVPIIGAVPLVGGGQSERFQCGRMVSLQPRSVGAEAVRTLRTALHFGVAGPESKLFVVTSPAPGDGKSTVASNLAIAMAQADQRVLLIDADMRKPTQHQIFGVESQHGLSSILTGAQPALEAVVPSGIPSLDFIPCGKRPANPAELLANGMFTEALEQLAEHYDKIVIDSPPVMAVTDSRLISTIVDCTILVLRAERSTRRLSVAARDELLKVRTERMGVVVNAAPMQRGGYGYGYGYGYGSYGQTAYGYGDEEVVPTRRRRRESRKRLTSEIVPSLEE